MIQINTETNERRICEYPRYDRGKIKDLPENIKYYDVIQEEKPEFDSNTHYLKHIEIIKDGDPIGTLTFTYEVLQYSNIEIIEILNTSLGNHLDTLYPEWERSKHAGESLRFLLKGQNNWDNEDLSRIAYIEETANWAKRCRQSRDQKESELLTNGMLPDFTWEDRPAKYNQ